MKLVSYFQLSSNVLPSVLVVLLNKLIFARYGVTGITLTCFHFAAMTLYLFVCERIGVFRRKSLPVADVFQLSLVFCGFVVFTNLSLQTNTVASYLVFKMATAPAIVIVEALWCCRKFSSQVLLSLVSVSLANVSFAVPMLGFGKFQGESKMLGKNQGKVVRFVLSGEFVFGIFYY